MNVDQIVEKYETLLEREGIFGMFDITDQLVSRIFGRYIFPSTKIMHLPITPQAKAKLIATQLNYTRLSLLRVKYKRNGNRSTGIKEGFVYAITNEFYKGYVKIGSTVDVAKRLQQYQTYSPTRNFVMDAYFFSYDRYCEEKRMHAKYNADGEWCLASKRKIVAEFTELRKRSKIKNPEEWLKG